MKLTSASEKTGFTLIEVLVATALLVIIVLMVGMVFRASTTAWDSGLHRADGNMLVRTVVGAIEHDLRSAVNAVDYGNLLGNSAFICSDNSAKFVALLGEDNKPVVVEYSASGQSVTRTVDGNRSVILSKPEASFGAKACGILTSFVTPDGWSSGSTNMPPWIGIEIELQNYEDFAGVTVYSVGRDGEAGTKDDIVSR